MNGKFYNREGYDLKKIPDSEIIYGEEMFNFKLDPVAPLYFLRDDGLYMQADRHEITDLGSVPPPLQPILSKTRCLLTWVMHDSGYAKGGLYVSRDGITYAFQKMTRKEIDVFMLMGMKAENLDWLRRTLAYGGVRLVGWWNWRKKRKRRLRHLDGILSK